MLTKFNENLHTSHILIYQTFKTQISKNRQVLLKLIQITIGDYMTRRSQDIETPIIIDIVI